MAKLSTLTSEEKSTIANRMVTLINSYSRENTIPRLSEKTGLSEYKIRKVLTGNNFYHGIKRNTGTASHPLNILVKYDDYKFLLDCTELDHMRMNR